MTDQLFEEWRIYEKLLIHDYMSHRAFFARLRNEIDCRFQRPLAILDLGCGDLSPVLPLLEGLPLQRYVGIDESDSALAMAAEQLAASAVPGRLVRGDLRVALHEVDGPFDLVLASFALHHLASPDDKLQVLMGARRVLAADGLFALVDVFCGKAEPRDHYLERWIANAEARYAELQAAEKAILFEHVRARDFPLPLQTWRELGRQAGLPRCEPLLEDADGLNQLVLFMA